MCGIAGAFLSDPALNTPEDAADAVLRMLPALAHRGPDGAGLDVARRSVLAHRRLALSGLGPAGAQPLRDPRSGVAIAVNGQFHDHEELRRRAEVRDFPFRGRSDSELGIPLYQAHGVDFLPLLRGPFALALVDRDKERLLLARDRCGQKPLFFARREGLFLFASEMGALLRALDAPQLDSFAALSFLRAGYVPAPRTVIAGVESLRPGHRLLIEGDEEPRIEPYFRIEESSPDPRTPADLGAALRDAVSLRARSERALAVLLSGGLDSGAVLAFATEATGTPPACFTLGFDDPAFDESEAAARSAAFWNAPHRIFRFEREPGAVLDDLVRNSGELLADSSWLAFSELCRQLRGDATVLLVGDGADELLQGYRRHALCRRADQLPRPLRAMFGALAPLARRPLTRRALNALAARDRAGALSELVGLLPWRELRPFLEPRIAGEDPLPGALEIPPGLAPHDAGVEAALRDFLHYLPGDLLPKADRAALAQGVETWAPFLDREVVACCLGLTARERRRKHALRSLLETRLPEANLRAPKKGFGVPLASWLREGSYGPFAREVLEAESAVFDGLLRDGTAVPLLERVVRGRDDLLAPLVHACVVLGLFHRHFLRGSAQSIAS